MDDKSRPAVPCGVFFKDAVHFYAGDDVEKIRIYAAGFCHGQAEKVHLGACTAAMFRPNKEYYSLQMEIVLDMARRFNLAVHVIHAAAGDEIWMSRHENIGEIAEMIRWNENSPEWHTIRGSLCGVSPDELDFMFHTRKGWGERTV